VAFSGDTEVINKNGASYGVSKGYICMLILLLQLEFESF
jgi:hypothetical protein